MWFEKVLEISTVFVLIMSNSVSYSQDIGAFFISFFLSLFQKQKFKF